MNIFKKTVLSLSLLIANTAAFADMNNSPKNSGEPPPCMQDMFGGCLAPPPGATVVGREQSYVAWGYSVTMYDSFQYSNGNFETKWVQCSTQTGLCSDGGYPDNRPAGSIVTDYWP